MSGNRFVHKIKEAVLIAGGTSGIGKGIALHLAKGGVKNIIIVGRNSVCGNEVVNILKTLGSQAYYIQADLSKVSGCETVVSFCAANSLSLGGLIYATGVCDRGTIETTSEQTWDQLFDTNVKGAFFLIQGMLPFLRRGLSKSVVTICSFSSYCGRPELIAYNASKSALVTLTRSLANTLKHERIRVNGINVGWTETENERRIHKALGQSDVWLDEISKKQPFGRLLKPDDIAHLVEFLLSEKSSMMTGSIIDLHQNVRI